MKRQMLHASSSMNKRNSTISRRWMVSPLDIDRHLYLLINCSRRPVSSAVVIDSIARLSVRPPIFHHETVVLDCEETRCRADQRVGQPFTCLRCRRPRHLQARSLFPPQTAVKPYFTWLALDLSRREN